MDGGSDDTPTLTTPSGTPTFTPPSPSHPQVGFLVFFSVYMLYMFLSLILLLNLLIALLGSTFRKTQQQVLTGGRISV